MTAVDGLEAYPTIHVSSPSTQPPSATFTECPRSAVPLARASFQTVSPHADHEGANAGGMMPCAACHCTILSGTAGVVAHSTENRSPRLSGAPKGLCLSPSPASLAQRGRAGLLAATRSIHSCCATTPHLRGALQPSCDLPDGDRKPVILCQENNGVYLALRDKQIRLGSCDVWAAIPGSEERASHSNRETHVGNANDVSSFGTVGWSLLSEEGVFCSPSRCRRPSAEACAQEHDITETL